jgi:hypothetical protein
VKENSIKEDIEILEKNIKSVKENADMAFFESDEDYCFFKAVEHILSDYKRVLKENNRLEEQVEYDKTHIYTPQTIELNFISKSKIEDKIKKLNDVSNAEELEDIMNRKNYTIVELVQYVLQELLERRK